MATAAIDHHVDAQPRSRVSKLQEDLAAKILRHLKDIGADSGHHLVEVDLCRAFDVSRTPIRGALRLLAEQGVIEARANRGYVLLERIEEAPESTFSDPLSEEDNALFIAIAHGRNEGRIPDQCSQQELIRLLDAKGPSIVRVLRQLASLGLAERKPGNGWSFRHGLTTERARADSFEFRSLVEPAALLAINYELDRDWVTRSRAEHEAFRRAKWRDTMAVDFFRVNADFHEGLARCSGNRYILDAIQKQNRLRSFLNIQWRHGPDRVIKSIEEHMAIFDLLEAGENHAAADSLREHLLIARRVLPLLD